MGASGVVLLGVCLGVFLGVFLFARCGLLFCRVLFVALGLVLFVVVGLVAHLGLHIILVWCSVLCWKPPFGGAGAGNASVVSIDPFGLVVLVGTVCCVDGRVILFYVMWVVYGVLSCGGGLVLLVDAEHHCGHEGLCSDGDMAEEGDHEDVVLVCVDEVVVHA